MFSDQTLSYLNTYRTGETGETPSEYSEKIKDFNEHMDSVTYTQVAGQDTPNDVSDDIYVGELEKRNKPNLNKDHLRVNVDEMNGMIGDSVLSNPEKMLQNRFNKFSRYGYIDPTHELVTGAREYLFFSKPDLNLVYNDNTINPQLSNVPFFNDAFNKYKLSYYALQQTYSSSSVIVNGTSIDLNNKYINILSNMVTSSLDLSDISASDVTGNQNLYQVNTSYREGSLASDLQYDFSLEFKDTKYLDVYMLFKIYDEYNRYKYMREIVPVRFDYIFNKIYPEALSIWKVIVDDTGRIMYWAKATGCTPMSLPRGSISNIEGNIKFTVNWKAQFIRDMDPINLTEINYLTARSIGLVGGPKLMTRLLDNVEWLPNIIPGYGNNGEMIEMNNTTWAGYPMIVMSKCGDVMNLPVRTGDIADTDKNAFYRLVWVNKKK